MLVGLVVTSSPNSLGHMTLWRPSDLARLQDGQLRDVVVCRAGQGRCRAEAISDASAH